MCSRAGLVEDRNGAGGVAEWPKVRHWKCRVGATLPWVRIPPPPPFNPQHGEAMLTVGEMVRAFVLAQSVVDRTDHGLAGWREGVSCEAAPEGRARGVLSVR